MPSIDTYEVLLIYAYPRKLFYRFICSLRSGNRICNHSIFQGIMKHAVGEGSFDGGDQGLLNSYFADWSYTDIHKHLPFLYNMVATATYSYTPAYRRLKKFSLGKR